MDAYDVMMDKYRAQQRFMREVQEELRCIKQCQASEDRSHCSSCLRTMEEIIACGNNKKENCSRS